MYVLYISRISAPVRRSRMLNDMRSLVNHITRETRHAACYGHRFLEKFWGEISSQVKRVHRTPASWHVTCSIHHRVTPWHTRIDFVPRAFSVQQFVLPACAILSRSCCPHAYIYIPGAVNNGHDIYVQLGKIIDRFSQKNTFLRKVRTVKLDFFSVGMRTKLSHTNAARVNAQKNVCGVCCVQRTKADAARSGRKPVCIVVCCAAAAACWCRS